ncbi:hypothetical protein D9615_004714 [Tricholomella constricta]|uniref:Uncharacterized protein n=1 Tax=Tricholomella constricta TaxID=117010 RepID=A0A8H5HBS2_9AGAR|nr:hypothetical protein D9615_004714 [Tricholomella constricta]
MPLFPNLADELSLAIIRLAATPTFKGCDQDPNPHLCYTTALSLARVSRNFYVEVMPILLHTVVLRSRKSLLAFHDFVQPKQPLAERGTNYAKLIQDCRIWSVGIEGNLDSMRSDEYLDYKPVYQILKKTKSLGLHNSTHHLLHNALFERDVDPAMDWTCREALFWGRWCNWTGLTCSAGGLAFLERLTRLTIWIEDASSEITDDLRGLPTWTKKIPFKHMPHLTHFACSLTRNDIKRTNPNDELTGYHTPTRMMVYIASPSIPRQDKHIIEQWLSDPLDTHGVVVEYSPSPRSQYYSGRSSTYSSAAAFLFREFWEEAYFCGDSDRAWDEASRQSVQCQR